MTKTWHLPRRITEMPKTLQQQVIEIITAQAISRIAEGRTMSWDDVETLFDTGPTVDEKWFWDNFGSMCATAEKQMQPIVEGWVTVEYEEQIVDRIKNVRRMFEDLEK